jgi:hypothetical protein
MNFNNMNLNSMNFNSMNFNSMLYSFFSLLSTNQFFNKYIEKRIDSTSFDTLDKNKILIYVISENKFYVRSNILNTATVSNNSNAFIPIDIKIFNNHIIEQICSKILLEINALSILNPFKLIELSKSINDILGLLGLMSASNDYNNPFKLSSHIPQLPFPQQFNLHQGLGNLALMNPLLGANMSNNMSQEEMLKRIKDQIDKKENNSSCTTTTTPSSSNCITPMPMPLDFDSLIIASNNTSTSNSNNATNSTTNTTNNTTTNDTNTNNTNTNNTNTSTNTTTNTATNTNTSTGTNTTTNTTTNTNNKKCIPLPLPFL